MQILRYISDSSKVYIGVLLNDEILVVQEDGLLKLLMS